MRPFDYERIDDPLTATKVGHGAAARTPPTMATTQFLAGGTTLLDLMKLDVMRPTRVIDINGMRDAYAGIVVTPHALHLGALAHMSEVADHPQVREQYPAIAQSLYLAASPQLRNMATLGGNVLQRTRCMYFRDPTWKHCNKRNPGSGCDALDGINRKHAVLGTSEHCIASYPGDFANVLIAFDARVEIAGRDGARTIPFAQLHREPGDTPHIETVLAPDDVITGFTIAAAPYTRRSLYLKIRDRQSYEFALASAAVGLDLRDDNVNEARIALGGVATRPWRSHEAEAALRGKPLTLETAQAAARAAFASAVTHGENDHKPELGRRTLVRALLEAARMERT
ncbi:MAG TPA: xanthine dehydrogenase family protein subunit M [Rhizomicrobium sp.]|jgi:xanthine dehydrogenase YagS FAD-binding subunit